MQIYFPTGEHWFQAVYTSSHELFSSRDGVDIFNICLNEVSRRRC